MNMINKVKVWLSKDTRSLWLATFAMIVFGLIAVCYISPYQAMRLGWPMGLLAQRYIPWLLAGIVLMIVCSRLSGKNMVRFSYALIGIGTFVTLTTLLHWDILSPAHVRLFFMLTMPAYIVLMSHWLGNNATKADRGRIMLRCAALTLLIVLAAFSRLNWFIALMYLLVFAVIAILSRKKAVPKTFFARILLGIAVVFGLAYLVFISPSMQQWWGSEYLQSVAYRVVSESGLLWFNNESICAISSLPDTASSFMYAGILGRFGICAGLLLLMLYYWVGKQIAQQAREAQRPFYKLLNSGVLIVFCVCILAHVSASIGGLRFDAYLPFVSLARMELLAFCIMFGLVLSKQNK